MTQGVAAASLRTTVERTCSDGEVMATEPTRARNPYVFVVGCPRSGTTLLQRMLDAHPMLAVANDTHFIPKALKGCEVRADLPLTPDLVERARSYKRFPRLGVPPGAVDAAAEAATYGEFVARLYDALAAEHGKPFAGEKTPDYCDVLPLLHLLFPAARVVHIVRDGRDVALSVLEWAHEGKGPGRKALWQEQPMAVSALWWREKVANGRRDGAALGPSTYRELRYEDLVADPERETQGLSEFLGLPPDPAMAGFAEGHAHPEKRSDGRVDAKKSWLPATSGLRDWRVLRIDVLGPSWRTNVPAHAERRNRRGGSLTCRRVLSAQCRDTGRPKRNENAPNCHQGPHCHDCASRRVW